MRRSLLIAAVGAALGPVFAGSRAFAQAGAVPGTASSAGPVPAPASADTPPGWPSRPLRLILPSAVGGPFDLMGRYLAEKLGPALGQNIVVENRSGATGTIAAGEVARAAPDGYTVGLIYMPHMVVPHMFGRLPYDTLRDLAPVTQTNFSSNLLVVNPSLPVQSLDELIALMRRKPGALSYGSGANGSPAHLITESLKAATGTFAVHVPYRGVAGALQGLLAGDVQFMFLSSGLAVPQVKSGRLRALAVVNATRLEALPDVPTLAQAGQPGIEARDWWGIVAPAATPPTIIERLNAEIRRALADPAIVKRFADVGIAVTTGTPKAFGELMASEYARWGAIVRKQGLKPD